MEVKTTAKKSTYKKMSKAQRQQLSVMNSEKRRQREENDHTVAIRRKAKARRYIAKKRIEEKNAKLQMNQATTEQNVGRMSSEKVLKWFKTLTEEEHRLNRVKQDIRSMAFAQRKEQDDREQALDK